jgi:vancomycin resistance protein YoaR
VRGPRAARFAIRGERVAVVPAVVGRRIDAPAVAGLIARRPAADAVPVRMEPIPPSRTTEQARAMRIRELVSEFTTNYGCCPPRVTNIRRAAAILDGSIIPAGAAFSLNEALGERTRERGFLPAPQINAGRLEDAVGGGVSQIATTFFNAAFFAGLRIVTHTPHEFYISRYPLGREATISWGGPELIVENDWPAAVLVKAAATDTGVTFRLYSDPLGRRVETETRGSPSGGTFTVSYTRKVWRGDELRRDEEWSWTYRPAPPD